VAAAAANTTASDTTPPTYPADRSPWPTEPASPPSSRLRRLISDDDNDVDLSADTMRTATGGSAPLDDDRKLPAHQACYSLKFVRTVLFVNFAYAAKIYVRKAIQETFLRTKNRKTCVRKIFLRT